MAAARIEQPALFELKEDCRPVSERTAAGRYREPSLFDVYAANAGISISDNRLRDSSALSSLVRTRGFNRGQGDERCGNCCQPPQRLIPASAQTGGKTPPRVIDRTSNRFDSKARPFGEALELALRAEPRSTPQRRAEPRANAARRRPKAPSAELADDEPAAGPQHARHLPEHGRCRACCGPAAGSSSASSADGAFGRRRAAFARGSARRCGVERGSARSASSRASPNGRALLSKRFEVRSITRGGVLPPVCALAGIKRWGG